MCEVTLTSLYIYYEYTIHLFPLCRI